jgi:hypothetical protein
MIDIIVRDCGHGEWLPIIRSVDGYGEGTELYRGNRVNGREAAWLMGKTAWDESTTGNIIEFKQEHGL